MNWLVGCIFVLFQCLSPLLEIFRYCHIFPSVNVKGTIKHLQLLPHELEQYEVQMDLVLKRYIRRLQWLLSGRFSLHTNPKTVLMQLPLSYSS